MKRAISCIGAAVLTSTACSPPAPEPEASRAEAADRWTRPPALERVGLADGGLAVSGTADPGARVVLRSDSGEAFAASADSAGRFEIRVPIPAGHLLLRPETRTGQEAALSPDHLLVLAGGRGPIVVLRPGGPARRLDAAPALGAVDSDGRMRLASGRDASDAGGVEVQSGGETIQVVPDSQGRWSVMLAPDDGPDVIRVGGSDFVWPGDAPSAQALTVTRMAGGWNIGWTAPGGARQSTWLPERMSP